MAGLDPDEEEPPDDVRTRVEKKSKQRGGSISEANKGTLTLRTIP